MATWETGSVYTQWHSNGSLLARTNVVSKITDEKPASTTLEAGERIKITVGAQEHDGTFLGTVTVNDVEYPVIRTLAGFRLIVGLDADADGVPSTLANSKLDTGDFTVCFFPGTLIATPSGERKVEELASGDTVLIGNSGEIPTPSFGRKFARSVSVKWIGRQTVSTLFGPAERLMPVRFAAGSLGGGAIPSAA